MNPKLLAGSLFAFALVVAAPGRAQAQSITVGPEVVYDTDFEAAGVGGQARFRGTFETYSIMLNPSVDFYFLDKIAGLDESLVDINVDVLFEFGEDAAEVKPYAGLGLNVNSYSFGQNVPGAKQTDTKAGLNVIGGATLNTRGAIRPFVQGTLTVGDGSRFALKGGVLLQLR